MSAAADKMAEALTLLLAKVRFDAPNLSGKLMGHCDSVLREFEAEKAQPAPEPKQLKSLVDRIIEGERELDGRDPQTLCLLMAEHWRNVSREYKAKADDYDRIKHELRLALAAGRAYAQPVVPTRDEIIAVLDVAQAERNKCYRNPGDWVPLRHTNAADAILAMLAARAEKGGT